MRKLLILAAATLGLSGVAQAADITGAGATFPFPIYSKWAEAYKKETGIGLNYQSIGSGGGIRQIKAKTVAFGATDAPLKGEDLAKDGLIQFPTVMGGVVPAINIAGVEARQLKLTGPLIAEIYMGTVKKWNDPKIVALNPGLKLPDANITPVYRSDGSGTTFVFTDYLSKVSADWKSKVGTNTSVQWAVGIGGKGNEGVSASVKQVANSIGYVEYAYAKQNKLSYALIQNADGQFPDPDDKSFQAAAANADWNAAPGFGISLNNQKGAEAWPITAATFLLVHAKPEKPEEVGAALKFVDWAFKNGDKLALDLEYVPLPATVKDQVRASWKGVTDPAGKPIF
ncbi:MAG: phosphate ABC transporter substrate-binding protein PstS [Methylobacterium sp.]|jgi:phosphate transport system substrate-binding protein|uniref:phosphate ABC transporter substrate-binding protein PstS n=1 Tax=Bosea sp. (in: a-proteobacteria) TaxID=1871050 RepID=UPI001DA55DCD|nr:phosphate ABC transporter substrate-binding protein PstS [Bosea sp. (in: a-proteobacteria)]MBA4270652.1 phosphate ABC transporter substrate-binding protein PstS [Methylobacterium sp.]MBA4333716.1 phosphate ABC transporter substrate-binding protein PstS [Methylobacterium sp.]MCZ8043176.1 phosphate ABC transporter substrate-binding protein PstS [Beijerinckiaceae bacterium]WRH56029.1 MAG: phosphate ABC transporter substrate-binding protein PstS [Bosea sp. (in: a-proteobacteria)]